MSCYQQNQYRSDLNWMKGVGWETEGCLNITQAKKAGELLSDVNLCLNSYFYADYFFSIYFIHFSTSVPQNKYRQKADKIKFTQVADDLSIKHAKKSQELQSDVCYVALFASNLLMCIYTI